MAFISEYKKGYLLDWKQASFFDEVSSDAIEES
jgi:hypothetical protein